MMGRDEAVRAKGRIQSYYIPRPDEVALGKKAEPFERAKSEWLKHARKAIEETEQMTLEDFQAAQNHFKMRKPTECGECGQEYAQKATNAEVKGGGA